jgi:hypothetical protein
MVEEVVVEGGLIFKHKQLYSFNKLNLQYSYSYNMVVPGTWYLVPAGTIPKMIPRYRMKIQFETQHFLLTFLFYSTLSYRHLLPRLTQLQFVAMIGMMKALNGSEDDVVQQIHADTHSYNDVHNIIM